MNDREVFDAFLELGGRIPGPSRLERELLSLEASDPAIGAARRRLDEATSEHERWRRQMVREVWS